jgi:hypothetical protein
VYTQNTALPPNTVMPTSQLIPLPDSIVGMTGVQPGIGILRSIFWTFSAPEPGQDFRAVENQAGEGGKQDLPQQRSCSGTREATGGPLTGQSRHDENPDNSPHFATPTWNFNLHHYYTRSIDSRPAVGQDGVRDLKVMK